MAHHQTTSTLSESPHPRVCVCVLNCGKTNRPKPKLIEWNERKKMSDEEYKYMISEEKYDIFASTPNPLAFLPQSSDAKPIY